ncbi:MAG: hypothetical protein ACXACC_00145 [Promethearchaeota archaeon]
MKIKWKTVRNFLPYICTNCGEFSSTEKEYCEHCGKRDTLRKTTREDYEKQTEKAITEIRKFIRKWDETHKLDKINSKTGDHPNWVGKPPTVKKIKTIYVVLIIFAAILIIDIVGYSIIAQKGFNDPFIFFVLLIFSLIAFIVFILLALGLGKASEYVPDILK